LASGEARFRRQGSVLSPSLSFADQEGAARRARQRARGRSPRSRLRARAFADKRDKRESIGVLVFSKQG
jgi:hypothetical protein